MRTPQIVLRPIGTRYPAISIPGSDQIRGVLIDNPSGAWLLLRPTNDYIPPYTLGWARSFMGAVASIDVAYESPAGQVSTLAGDPAVVVLDTETVEPSSGMASGVPFVEQFTPGVFSASAGSAFNESNPILNDVLVAAVANQRIRVLTISVSVVDIDVPWSPDITVAVTFPDLDNLSFIVGGANRKAEYYQYPPGTLDLPINTGLEYSAAVLWDVATGGVRVTVTYQLI